MAKVHLFRFGTCRMFVFSDCWNWQMKQKESYFAVCCRKKTSFEGFEGGCGLIYRFFMVGKRRTSRIVVVSVSNMTRRSIPMPSPPVGGMPYSRASTKS